MATISRIAGSNDWAAASFWSSGAAPADGEDLIIPEGADTFAANIAVPGDDYQSVTITPGFSGNGGSGGPSPTYMEFDVDQTGTGVFDYNGAGDWWNQRGGTGGTIHKIVIRPIKSGFRFNLVGADNSILQVENGIVYIGTDATLVDAEFTGGQGVIDTNASDTLDVLTAVNARVTLKRDFTTANIGPGATLIWDAKGITGGTVNLYGGTLLWIDGNLGNINGYGGVLDQRQLRRGVTGGTLKAGRSMVLSKAAAPSAEVTFQAEDLIASGPQRAT